MRAPGEGSVYRRADGRWVAQVEAGHHQSGRRRYLRRIRDTRREAYDALHELRRRQGAGIGSDLTGQTLADFLGVWIDTLELAPKTIAAYRCDLNHIIAHIGHVHMGDLDPQHVRHLLAATRDDLAPKSRRNMRATLHRAVKQAVRDRRLDWNPVSVVEPPRVDRPDVDVLTADEVRELLAADQSRHRHMWRVTVAVGWRLGEALGLVWPRVDGDVLRIRHQLRRVDGEYRLADLKNRKVRDVPMPGWAAAALREQRRIQLAGDGPGDWRLVWPAPTGRPQTDTVPRNQLSKLSLQVLGRRINPHTLRHTAATLMIARGVPLSIVSDILGHSSIQVTKDLYGHLDVDQLRPGARALDDLFGTTAT